MANNRHKDKRRRLLLRWSGLSLGVTLATGAVIAGLSRSAGRAVPAAGADVAGLTSVLTQRAEDAEVPFRFEDVTGAKGLRFRHFPAVRASLLPEDMGSGVACGDYDNDGFPDVFLVNFAGSIATGATIDAEAGRSRLFRNVAGERFEDVTDAAGIRFAGFGMGACWGDYDNDGDLDLYLTAYGPDVLLRNNGNGTFTDVTTESGLGDGGFGAGCAWADYDRDGDVDLYVTRYVDFVYREQDRQASARQYESEQPHTLNPSSCPPQPNALFRNDGEGASPRFVDVARQAGVDDPEGRSLSVSWADLNNDGWPDLYTANDVSRNGVFLNLGDGTFADIGASSMAADYRGAMGLTVADFDNDGDNDLFITHWIAQENGLYRNMLLGGSGTMLRDSELYFMDEADQFGLGQISLDMVGWATGFADFDNDGRRDLWIVNGSTMEHKADHAQLVAQRALVMWQRDRGGFVDVAASASPRLAEPIVGRGGAQLDFDRDGRMDLVFVVHGGEAILLHNASPQTGNWLRIALRQRGGNTQALGARVYVTCGSTTQMAEVGVSSSYLSQDETVLHFGLGDAEHVDRLRVVWPDGSELLRDGLAINQTFELTHVAAYPVPARPEAAVAAGVASP